MASPKLGILRSCYKVGDPAAEDNDSGAHRLKQSGDEGPFLKLKSKYEVRAKPAAQPIEAGVQAN